MLPGADPGGKCRGRIPPTIIFNYVSVVNTEEVSNEIVLLCKNFKLEHNIKAIENMFGQVAKLKSVNL